MAGATRHDFGALAEAFQRIYLVVSGIEVLLWLSHSIEDLEKLQKEGGVRLVQIKSGHLVVLGLNFTAENLLLKCHTISFAIPSAH
jgi:hypothetical protein